METLLQDIRYAARRLAKSPGFTLVAALTLALGIGANSAIFSVVNAVLLQPLPYPQPERLDRVWTTHERHGNVPTSAPDFLQQQAENRSYESLAAISYDFPSLTGEGDPVRLNGTNVSATFFDVLGVEPEVGRTFTAEENEPGRTRVAVIGHALWRQRFGGDRGVIGSAVQLDGVSYQVVGVMPAGFDYPSEREIWTPLEYGENFRDDNQRAAHYLNVIGRRKPGVTTEEAAADIAAIGARIREQFPELKASFDGSAVSLREELVGDIRLPLLILLGAVGFVLLIACVNVANLLLARAAARESELAVRTALGARRGRLVRQLLTETVLLSLVGGALGLLLAVWGVDWLVQLQPEGIPRLERVGVDGTVLAFTTGLAVLTGVVFGLAPAYQVTRGELIGSIREGGRGALAGRATVRLRSALVVVETALAVMLLAGAGLLIRSFAELRSVDPGFRTENVLAVDLALPAASYPEDARVLGFYDQLAERLRAAPGVVSVGLANGLPMSGIVNNFTFRVEGRPDPRPGEETTMETRIATPGYFATLGIPVVRGRGLSPDDRAGSPPVVVISEAAAERFFPGEDPIGQRITVGSRRNGEPIGGEVVGVVGSVHNEGLAGEPTPMIYLPQAQVPARVVSLVVRSGTEPSRMTAAVRREVAALDPSLPLFNTRTLEESVGDSVSQPRFYMLLLSVFAGCALVLAAIGIFGVMSYAVVQRTREIGIRVALGAEPASVLRMVVGGAVGLCLLGVAVGMAGALAGSRLLSGLLFGVAPTDPLTLGTVAALLTGVALLASYLPARKATRVDPMVALRAE